MKKDKKHKCLTIAELRQFKDFDSISDEEARNTIATLEKFSILLFELYQKKQEFKEINSLPKGKTNGKRGAA